MTFAEEEPAPLPSVSPAMSMNQHIANQFSPFPFSPPLPSSSAASNGPQGFPFQTSYLQGPPSGPQSPGIPPVVSPIGFNAPVPGRFNAARASISISPHELPFHMPGQPPRWSPQMLLHQQQMGRNGSPGMFNMASPISPFSPDGMHSPLGAHQRHQSLQFPMLPHQFLQRHDSARASPRLQEVREDEEEEETQTNPYQSPSKTPEPTQFIQHNASNSLQKEIDEAEYHLEEQFRSQLEHEDYSPHNEIAAAEAEMPVDKFVPSDPLHGRGPSVHFSGIGAGSDEGLQLHHPQPHSRGHSLSQKAFFDDEVRDSTDEGSMRKPLSNAANNAYEIDTNPSNVGSPQRPYDFTNQRHQRSVSITSNPWAESDSFSSKLHSRQGSHNSKPSLSKLNASAAEFKFNPRNNFTPGQFVFGGQNAQPAPPFTPGPHHSSTYVPPMPQSAKSNHVSVSSNTSSIVSRINPAAPVFSPQRSDFSFSSSGPKFNPDAKAFQPRGLFPSNTNTTTAAIESNESLSKPIFGDIDLNSSEYDEKAKSVPILQHTSQPSSPHVSDVATTEAPAAGEEHLDIGASRLKKQFRNGINGDDDDVPRFAEPTPEPELAPSVVSETSALEKRQRQPEDDVEPELVSVPISQGNDEDESGIAADVTLASTVVSESTEGKPPSESNGTKATTSPSATSPDPEKGNWMPMKFANEHEAQDFNNARPLGEQEPLFVETEKPHLSVNATPFVPGNFTFGSPDAANIPFEPDFNPQPEQLTPSRLESDEEDLGGSPTPGPDMPLTSDITEAHNTQEDEEAPEKSASMPGKGLLLSRFASPPPPSKGLKSSRFAPSPSVSPQPTKEVDSFDRLSWSPASVRERSPLPQPEESEVQGYEPLSVSPPSDTGTQPREPTFEEIDAVMQQINENDPNLGVKRSVEAPKWRSPSPSPRRFPALPQENVHPKPTTELEDPFMDPPVHRLNTRADIPESEWDDAFSEREQGKLEQRVHYFDGHVNDLVGSLLASRLNPLSDLELHVFKRLYHSSFILPLHILSGYNYSRLKNTSRLVMIHSIHNSNTNML